ncbi:MAG: branched-chain amino acid transport system II carrier protein, partial [Chlamydiia bacterium]|nr:branched-chain amino acid transport system II carrier protein [Chlamydiia bacterium]
MSILGSWLTPVLLASLVAIVGCAYWQSGTHSQSNALQYGFMEGMFTGYQTMDLLAALFFATFVVKNIEKQARKLGICVKQLFGWVALVGMGLLAVVYGALVLLGSLYASDLSDVAPERLLCAISVQTLGAFSGVFICVVVLACLTTAIVLTALFAEYLHKRLPWNQSVVITLGIALVVSSLNFNGIAAYIGPILEVLYPAIVAVSLHLVLVKVGYMQRRVWLFPLAAFCSLMVYVA